MAGNAVLAASFTVTGVHGVLLIFAVALFAIAAIIAWFAPPRTYWGAFMAAASCLLALSMLVT